MIVLFNWPYIEKANNTKYDILNWIISSVYKAVFQCFIVCLRHCDFTEPVVRNYILPDSKGSTISWQEIESD